MTLIQPPSYIQGTTDAPTAYSAAADRRTFGALLQSGTSGYGLRGGVRPESGGQGLVVSAGSGMTVTVTAGTAFVPDSTGGVYACHNNGTVTVTVPAASSSQSRIDRIVAQVKDAEYGDTGAATNTWSIDVIPGTPSSGTPVVPALPERAWPLARVLVPANATSITSGNVTDDRGITPAALGGWHRSVSTDLPSAPFPGMAVYCTDDFTLRTWDPGQGVWQRTILRVLPNPARAIDTTMNGPQPGAQDTWSNLNPSLSAGLTLSNPAVVAITFSALLKVEASVSGALQVAVTGSGATVFGEMQEPTSGGPLTVASHRLYALSTESNRYYAMQEKTIWARFNEGTTIVTMRTQYNGAPAVRDLVTPALYLAPIHYI